MTLVTTLGTKDHEDEEEGPYHATKCDAQIPPMVYNTVQVP